MDIHQEIKKILERLIYQLNGSTQTLKDEYSRDPSETSLDLNRADKDLWEKFCAALASSKSLTTLEFCNWNFGNLEPSRWQAFCEALGKISFLQKLSLRSARLYRLDITDWQFFVNAIRALPQLTFLNLPNNTLYGLHTTGSKVLFDAIFGIKTLRCLDLSSNLLVRMTEPSWGIFCNAFAANQTLRKIFFNQNEMNYISTKPWELFFENGICSKPNLYSFYMYDLYDTRHNFSMRPIFQDHRVEAVKLVIDRRCNEKHGVNLAAAHSLRRVRLQDNGLHSRTLPSGVIRNILAMFDGERTLNEQVMIEVDDHVKRRNEVEKRNEAEKRKALRRKNSRCLIC